jgi:DNA-binding NarL/FixJ family response regulator
MDRMAKPPGLSWRAEPDRFDDRARMDHVGAGTQVGQSTAAAADRPSSRPATAPASRTVLAAGDSWHDQPLAARLTRREREVLTLLRARLTDAEIAQLLCVSPRTVDTHVGNILRKLGVANRRTAGDMAVGRGLV